MIRTLDEAIAHAAGRHDARAHGRGGDRPVLGRPGCGALQLAALLRELPGLPESYVELVEAVAVAGVRLGAFGLSPPGRPEQGLRPRLLRAADPRRNRWAEHHQLHHVYEVGLIRRDPIAVAGEGGRYRAGQVVWYHRARAAPLVLADRFERFVIIAANLDAVRRRCDEEWGDVEAAVAEVEACVGELTGDEELLPVWRHIASETLELV